jgi:cytochrome c oxidase cbb3-type subunit 2
VVFLAATYVYFLIFAQFGFLKRLGELGLVESGLKPVMAAMAVGGVLMSVAAPRVRLWNCPKCRLQTGLIGCAWMAGMTLLPLNPMLAMAVAAGIGLSLGLLTVTLVSYLPCWIGRERPLMKIALGTGLGYAICNVPWIFNAGARGIAWVAVAVCLGATLVANRVALMDAGESERTKGTVSFGITLTWFTALVWLDSAAFFIIQNSAELKAGTWQGNAHLWRTGVLHLAGAVVAGLLLAKGRVRSCLGLAFGFLAAACCPKSLRNLNSHSSRKLLCLRGWRH